MINPHHELLLLKSWVPCGYRRKRCPRVPYRKPWHGGSDPPRGRVDGHGRRPSRSRAHSEADAVSSYATASHSTPGASAPHEGHPSTASPSAAHASPTGPATERYRSRVRRRRLRTADALAATAAPTALTRRLSTTVPATLTTGEAVRLPGRRRGDLGTRIRWRPHQRR